MYPTNSLGHFHWRATYKEINGIACGLSQAASAATGSTAVASTMQPCAEVRHPLLPRIAQTVVRDIISTSMKRGALLILHSRSVDVCTVPLSHTNVGL